MLHVKHIPHHFIYSVDWANVSGLTSLLTHTFLLKLSISVLCLPADANQLSNGILSYFRHDSAQVTWIEYGPYGDTVLHLEQKGLIPTGSLDNLLQVYAAFLAQRISLILIISSDNLQMKMRECEKDSHCLYTLRLLATAPQRLTFLEDVSRNFTTRNCVLAFDSCPISQIMRSNKHRIRHDSQKLITRSMIQIASSLLPVLPLEDVEIEMLDTDDMVKFQCLFDFLVSIRLFSGFGAYLRPVQA